MSDYELENDYEDEKNKSPAMKGIETGRRGGGRRGRRLKKQKPRNEGD